MEIANGYDFKRRFLKEKEEQKEVQHKIILEQLETALALLFEDIVNFLNTEVSQTDWCNLREDANPRFTYDEENYSKVHDKIKRMYGDKAPSDHEVLKHFIVDSTQKDTLRDKGWYLVGSFATLWGGYVCESGDELPTIRIDIIPMNLNTPSSQYSNDFYAPPYLDDLM